MLTSLLHDLLTTHDMNSPALHTRHEPLPPSRCDQTCGADLEKTPSLFPGTGDYEFVTTSLGSSSCPSLHEKITDAELCERVATSSDLESLRIYKDLRRTYKDHPQSLWRKG